MRAQVSALNVCGRELYVGTSWGCIVVADASSMRPITVFRPYQDEVRAILTLWPPPPDGSLSVDHDRKGNHTATNINNNSSNSSRNVTSVKSNEAASDIFNCNSSFKISESALSSNSSVSKHTSVSSKNESITCDNQSCSSSQTQQILSPTSQKSFSNVSNKSMSSFSLSSSSVTSSTSSTNIHHQQQHSSTIAANTFSSVEASEIDYSEVTDDDGDDIFSSCNSGASPLVATIGKGYRNLLARYAPMPKAAQPDANSRAIYCLLWRPDNWIN